MKRLLLLLLHSLSRMPETNMTGWWKFDDGSGQVLTDYSSGGHDGELGSTSGSDANDPTWSSTGLTFGADDYLTVSDSTDHDSTAGITLHFALKRTINNPWNVIAAKESWNAGTGWVFNFNAATEVQIHKSGGNNLTATCSAINSWHLYTATVTASGTAEIFEDNVSLGTSAANHLGAQSRAALDMYVGAMRQFDGTATAQAFFTGDIGYAAIYNAVQSDGDRTETYRYIQLEMSKRGVTIP